MKTIIYTDNELRRIQEKVSVFETLIARCFKLLSFLFAGLSPKQGGKIQCYSLQSSKKSAFLEVFNFS